MVYYIVEQAKLKKMRCSTMVSFCKRIAYLSFAKVETSPEFEEFLEFLGEKIVLKGWTRFRGGLDVKSKSLNVFSFCAFVFF